MPEYGKFDCSGLSRSTGLQGGAIRNVVWVLCCGVSVERALCVNPVVDVVVCLCMRKRGVVAVRMGGLHHTGNTLRALPDSSSFVSILPIIFSSKL